MPIMYILSYLLISQPQPSAPTWIFCNALCVLLKAIDTPASRLDPELKNKIWLALYQRHYCVMRNKTKAKHLCSVKTADVSKVIAAAKSLGMKGELRFHENSRKIRDTYIVFQDGSYIPLNSSEFFGKRWRNK